MRHYFGTARDLRNWVDDMTSDWCERGDGDVDEIVAAISDLDPPRYGDDWTEYLENLPALEALLKSE